MTSARLLVFALLASSLFSLAQAQQEVPHSGLVFEPKHFDFPLPDLSEPWQLIADQPQQSNPTQRLQDGISQYHPEGNFPVLLPNENLDKGIAISPSGDGPDDHFCFKIRSYVVARDSKNSDSTHFVRSSTCQPASKYRVKTTQMEHGGLLPMDAR
jgi:hypothetical protein